MANGDYDPIDIAALDLTSETGQENALGETIAKLNIILAVLQNAGTSVPLLGSPNSGGLLSAQQKSILTGGPTSNADSLHTHSGIGTGGTGGTGGGGTTPLTAQFIMFAPDATVVNGVVLQAGNGLSLTSASGIVRIGLPITGVVPGSYTKVVTDVYGRVLAGGQLGSADIPSHQHDAGDIVTGTFAGARFAAGTIPLATINVGAAPDGQIATVSGGVLVMAAAPAGTGEVNTASNVNTGGQGLFKQKTAANLEFRGIAALAGLLATLDTPNNLVDLAPDFGTGHLQIPFGDHNHDTRYYQKAEVDALVKFISTTDVSANYTVVAADQYLRVTATGAISTISLPVAATSHGRIIRIKRFGSSAFAVNIVPNGTDRIDRTFTSWELWDNLEYVTLVAAGNFWEVIESSGSVFPIKVPAIGASFTLNAKPQSLVFDATATVNGGHLVIAGLSIGQVMRVLLRSGAGGLSTVFQAGSGMGSIFWPLDVVQPPTTTATGKTDEFFFSFDGVNLDGSVRGQGY